MSYAINLSVNYAVLSIGEATSTRGKFITSVGVGFYKFQVTISGRYLGVPLFRSLLRGINNGAIARTIEDGAKWPDDQYEASSGLFRYACNGVLPYGLVQGRGTL